MIELSMTYGLAAIGFGMVVFIWYEDVEAEKGVPTMASVAAGLFWPALVLFLAVLITLYVLEGLVRRVNHLFDFVMSKGGGR